MLESTTERSAVVKPVLPGATIGMVGGGQLGRMFAMAAATMGYRMALFCNNEGEPASQVCDTVVCGDLADADAIDRFARHCSVITLEFENIPAATIRRCEEFAPTYPASSVLETAQDRWLEKTRLKEAGLPVTPFARVDSEEALARASESLGRQMVVKTQRSGYDGKGQHKVDLDAVASPGIPWENSDGWVAESLISFDCEISVIVARSRNGECKAFPAFENRHRNHILDVTILPADVPQTTAEEARSIAVRAAESLDVIGLLCVEFFVQDGVCLINEVAPRPHNSGHVTMAATHVSQFEQHVRAVCGLPLGDTSMVTPAAAMMNLLGEHWHRGTPNWAALLAVPGVQLHLYGKQSSRPGRKMGHVNAVGSERQETLDRLRYAIEQLRC
ncbi:MAG: 5-(carboxyamino)imidazole ribonucleotide synthase [Planctomycetota bacterium]